MKHTPIFIGKSPARAAGGSVTGQFVEIEGESFYRIQHVDQMTPFFMSIVSDSDHWMFVSSLGGLSAGRKNPDHALFPYTTVDKIHDSSDLTGSKTILLVEKEGATYLWEPFSTRYSGVYACTQNLYKSVYGDKVRFESVNEDLGVRFSYTWCTGEQFGFVKKSEIENIGEPAVTVRLLDGIQNLLHFGIERIMQSERSNLLDAYKKNELDGPSGVGIFALSSLVVDKPIPSEALKATTVWCTGLNVDAYLVSMKQLDAFRRGDAIHTEMDVRAERGGYFIESTIELQRNKPVRWFIVAEINKGPEEVVALIDLVRSTGNLKEEIENDLKTGTAHLKYLVGSADGIQLTQDPMTTTRHFSNVLFNIMRGGIFDNHTLIDTSDLRAVVKHFNEPLAERHASFFDVLPEEVDAGELIEHAASMQDPQLKRVCYEYLPLIFSRRHGDPSRPWNMFSIDLRNEDGSTKRSYQGNWRDIFQNWEALCLSFPLFTESIISKFVNASTVDGYNPYRITQDGIDWEVMDPHDPWSYIGYWGDHQIIYLLKLLEISRAHHPEQLASMLSQDIFAYANVPYRIKPYRALLEDPHNTILYDEVVDAQIEERVARTGADGKLVWNGDNQVYLVNLTEKLLVSVLAKLSNFVPGGGIWMNTQRPEWNDANNALVGYGVSMVTLYYLRRFNRFMADLFGHLSEEHLHLSEEVEFLLVSIGDAFAEYRQILSGPITDHHRKDLLDALGEAGSAYRMMVYERGFTGNKKTVSADDLAAFFELTLEHIDHTIWANQRSDDLFHAYNLLQVEKDGISISYLYEMLEGQVAVLSAGVLSASQTVDVLKALKKSALYREDQNSYVLYPDRQLARFTDKNKVPKEDIQASALLRRLAQDGDSRLIVQDQQGAYRFNGNLRDREALDEVLDALEVSGYQQVVPGERAHVQSLYSDVFGHTAYTGRSGTFFGYEGLGCIYWHMVSKLVLAIKEAYYTYQEKGENQETLGRLVEAYYDVRAGIGLNKPPEVYGAFPFDPYSHTPGHAGAKQPGMTGQVKEDIISRWGELGIVVDNGCIQVSPILLRAEEFLQQPGTIRYTTVSGEDCDVEVNTGSLAFTYCQVLFVYSKSDKARMVVQYEDGGEEVIEGLVLPASVSSLVLNRTGAIRYIEVDIPASLVLQ